MATDNYRWLKSWRGVLVITALLFAGIIFYRHYSIPKSELAKSLAGVYVIIGTTSLQIPDVFRGETLTIRDSGNGKVKATNERGKKLNLSQCGDGLSFKENFSPVGPVILLGHARNWNEGRLRNFGDGTVVEGSMRQKGLSVFGPFEDVTQWRIQLKRIADAPAEQQPRAQSTIGLDR